MKNFINYFMSLIAILAITISCQKEESNGDSEVGNEFIITAEVATLDTKVGVDGLDALWAEGDMLSVCAKSVTNGAAVSFALNAESIGLKKGVFEGELVSAYTEYFYAIYPHNTSKTFNNSGNPKYTFSLPVEQTQKFSSGTTIDPTSLGKYLFLHGKSANKVASGVKTNASDMSMNHVMSILDFVIKGVPATNKIYSLAVTAGESKFANSLTADLDASTVELGSLLADKIEIDLENNEGVSGVVGAAGDITIRMAMFPQEFAEGQEWIVELATSANDGTVVTDVISYTMTFVDAVTDYEAGMRYIQEINYSEFLKPLPPAEIKSEENCYIVKPSASATTFSIPAVARVNAFWKTGGDGGSVSQNLSYPYGFNNHANAINDGDEWFVEVIWADIDCVSKVKFEQNATAFGVGDEVLDITLDGINTQGNIIFGLKKKDGTDYLWSWHIWVSDVDTAISTELLSGQKIMDRNLGARAAFGSVNAADAYGFFYQWGRKDPFPPSQDPNSAVEPAIYRPSGSGEVFTPGFGSITENGSITGAIYSPLTYFVGEDWAASGPDASVSDSKRWSSIAGRENTPDGRGEKSLFDPCPEGWRVPWGENWTGSVEDDGSYAHVADPAGVKYANNDNARFPLPGYRDFVKMEGYTSLQLTGYLTYSWSSCPSRLFSYGAYSTLVLGAEMGDGPEFGNSDPRASGLGVRPVRDI